MHSALRIPHSRFLAAFLLLLTSAIASAATYVHTTSATLHAYPRSNADFSDWATEAVELVEDGSTGIYEADLHRGWGETWMVFTSDPPSAWSEAVGVIELPWTGPYLDVSRDTPYGIQVDTSGTETDFSIPLNWALENCNEPDPADRTPAGGPAGCFFVFVAGLEPGNGSDPAPMWSVQSPIAIPADQAGGKLLGVGRGASNQEANQGLASRLLWAPGGSYDSDDPMVVCQGNSWDVRDISFIGREDDDEGTNQAICWLNFQNKGGDVTAHSMYDYVPGVTRGQNAVTTEIKMHGCGFHGWTLAVQNGITGDNNCDHMRMEECFFYGTTTAWKNMNSQGVDIFFTRNYGGTATTLMYDFQLGGKAYFKSDTVSAPGLTYLNIGRGPGVTDGYFSLEDVTFDAGVGTTGYLVFMEDRNSPPASSIVTIMVRGGQDSNTSPKTTFVHLESNTDFSINGWKKIGPISCERLVVSPGEWRPRVNIENCMVNSATIGLDIEDFLMLSEPEHYILRTRNNSQNTNAPTGIPNRPIFLKDINPDGGFPVLSR